MRLKWLILSLLLASKPSLGVEGYIENRFFVSSNRPIQLDATGLPVLYTLDLELRFDIFQFSYGDLELVTGFDSSASKEKFSRAAGRLGLTYSIYDYTIGIMHRSDHNFDYVNGPGHYKFYSEESVFLRYNFNSND